MLLELAGSWRRAVGKYVDRKWRRFRKDWEMG